FSLSFHLAPFSASHFRITSATWRLFLSIIIMSLLPLMPMSGRTASAARPPAALIALTASRQPLRLASPLTVCLAPTLLSPHSESTGTLAKYEVASLSLKPSQPPSTVTSARTSFGRWRTRSRPYTPDCEWTTTTEAPMRSSSAASAVTVLTPIPASEVSAFGTSCIVYCSIAWNGNCSPGNGTDQEGPSRKLSHARSCVGRGRVGSEAGFAQPESRARLRRRSRGTRPLGLRPD